MMYDASLKSARAGRGAMICRSGIEPPGREIGPLAHESRLKHAQHDEQQGTISIDDVWVMSGS